MKKRLLSALLAMAMVLTMLPVSAFAEEETSALYVGLSQGIEAMSADIKAATGMTASGLDTSDTAKNLLWFVIKGGLEAETEYAISVKNGDKEILTKNAIDYTKPNEDRKFKPGGSSYLLFVSLDQASADGETGQVNSTSLGDGTEETTLDVTVTKAADSSTVVTGSIKVQKKDNDTWTVVKEPSFVKAGFNQDIDKAHAEINEFLTEVRGSGSVNKSDVDKDTMYVSIDNLDTTKSYEVVVTKEGESDQIYREPKEIGTYLTGKEDTVVYFTFNRDNEATGSVATVEVGAGKYTFTLNEVDNGKTTPKDTMELTLGKITLVPGAGAKMKDGAATDYYGKVGAKLDVSGLKAVKEDDSTAESTGWKKDGVAVTEATFAETDVVTLTAAFESDPETYDITVDEGIQNGAVEITNPEGGKAAAGDTVTLKATPNAGYKLKANSVKVTKTGAADLTAVTADGTDAAVYTFEMPAYAVTVSAEFEEDKELKKVEIDLPGIDNLAVGEDLPPPTATTGVDVAVEWFAVNGDGVETKVTADQFETEGKYVAKITVTVKTADGYTLAEDVTYTLNGEDVEPDTGVVTVEDITVAAEKTAIDKVDVTLSAVKVGDLLPDAETNANVTLETVWKKDGAIVAADATAEVGQYDVEITATAKPGYKLTEETKYTLNGNAAVAADGKITTTVEVTAETKKISEIAIELPEKIYVNGDMPELTVTTVPADGADVVTTWKKSDGETVEAADVSKTAGSYTAEFAVTLKPGFELAKDVVYKVNGRTVGKDDLKATLTVEALPEKETAVAVGFEAVGADAVKAIADKGFTAPETCEDNTMYALFAGLSAEKTYKVVVTDANDGEVNASAEISEQTTAMVAFAVPQGKLASGKYTAALQVKNQEGEFTAVEGATAEVELHKLTVKNGEEVISTTYYESSKTVNAPAALENTPNSAFKGWKNGDKMVTSVAMTADVTLEAVFENYVILDGSLVVVDENTLFATLNADRSITISGVLVADENGKNVTLQYKMSNAPEEVVTAPVIHLNYTEADGYTVEENTKITAAGIDYAVKADITVSPVEIVAAAPVVDTTGLKDAQGNAVSEDDAKALAEAVSATTVSNATELVVSKVNEVETDIATVEDGAAAALKAAEITVADSENVTVVAQPITDVKTETYDETAGVLTLNISAGYRLIAVENANVGNIVVKGEEDAAAGEKANAVALKTTVFEEVNSEVTIVVGLPDALAEKEGVKRATIPVLHGKGAAHYHTATVEGSTGAYTATITSTDGLSPFTFEAAAELKAEYDGKQYGTLQDAVDAIPSNATTASITVLADDATATVNRAITITLVAGDGVTLKDTMLTAGSNYELDGAVEDYVFKFKSKSGGSTNPGFVGGGGGASGTTTYSVNVPTVEHGTVTVNPRNAAKDATVTITVSPNQGYSLGTLTVTDKDGNNVELTKVENNKYTFKMPASRVEIKATFVEGEAPATTFTDVQSGEYYYDAVLWAVDKGITTGLTETTFGPNASCTRAQMVTFLWRAAGSPEPTGTANFTDIDANEYYYKAVLWAVEKGITTGTTETTFSPNATVTRGQTVTFLYRYAGSPAAQGNNAFTDVEASEYYANAVTWAAANGITTGTTSSTFSPANNCTRGQIVTFLYRQMVK